MRRSPAYLSSIFISMFTLCGMMVGVEGVRGEVNSQDFVVGEAFTVISGPPVLETPIWTAEPPALTAKQRAKLKYWIKRSHLLAPPLNMEGALEPVGPEPETESNPVRYRSMEPRVPGTAILFSNNSAIGAVIPDADQINIMECSVAQGGRWVFYTGNLFAARSADKGTTWTYVNPWNGFSDFCCDQVAIYDESRGLHIWLRQGDPPPGDTGNNVFKLGVSNNGGATFYTYTFSPLNFNSTWYNQWFDFPHMQLGADYLYITYNIHGLPWPPGNWIRTLIMRFPLDALAAFSSSLIGNYTPTTDWFTWVPIQGADHRMYWASNVPTTTIPANSRIAIWYWNEDAALPVGPVIKNVAAWTLTDSGTVVCGATAGNWTGRAQQKLLTGARYNIQGTNLKVPGREILGWWWNVKQGGSFLYPYIDGAAFYEDTLGQVPGTQGRPLLWSNIRCFAYPSVAVNQRGDLGMVFHVGTTFALNPSIGYAIADDFTTAPPGWTFYYVRYSNARPTQPEWGDYNTVRVYDPSHDIWSGAAHYLPGIGMPPLPVFFCFGRERDTQSYVRW